MTNGRTSSRSALGALAIVALFALALPAAWVAAPAHGSFAPAGGSHLSALAQSGHARSAAHPSSGPVATGRGVFFDNHLVPNASSGTPTCYGTTCVNVSNNPSINWTSSGAIAVAYTSWTNASPCLATHPYAQSEIGVVVSTNGGTSWSSPTYLGAPSTCSAAIATAEPNAWQPSLTSLSNGTLVLAYIAFNTSGPLSALKLGPTTYTVTTDRLLLTESYNNGATWTSPQTLNVSDNPGLNASSRTAERPWATATGNTIYVTWMNATAEMGFSAGVPVGSSGVQLLVSTNGGSSWSTSPIGLPTAVTTGQPSVAINPTALVLPSGQLEIAYATNFSYRATFGCQNGTCLSGVWASDVVVASSANNGSTFTVAKASSGSLAAPSRNLDAFVDPSPQVAYGPSSHQLFVTFAAGEVLTVCHAPGACSPVWDPEVVYIANSSTSGASWTAAHPVDPGLWQFGLYAASFGYNPGVTVDRNGTVDLVFTYDNYSICQPSLFFGQFCGPQQEVFVQSTDNGTTFAGPYLVSSNWTQLFFNPQMPDGEYATAVAAGGQLWLAWTLDVCPGWATTGAYQFFPTSACTSQISLSHLFNGPGVTLTFSETGLKTGVGWNVSVMGNDRRANAPTTLSVSGVPTSDAIDWILAANISAGYGDRYTGVPSLFSPQTFSSSTTITVAYSQQYLVDVSTVPVFPPFVTPTFPYIYCFSGYPATAWNDPTCPGMNYNVTMTPAPAGTHGPGSEWVAPGTTFVVNVTKIGSYYCNAGTYCSFSGNDVLNLSFQSWTGAGNGSVNTTNNLTTIVANGPVNETANFLFIGYCYVSYSSSPAVASCLQVNTTLLFHETGLPNGTAWTVSVSSLFGSTTASNSTPWLPIVGAPTIGPASFQVWTVPATGGYWVPTTNPLSPVQIPATGLVNVNFTFDASLSGSSFPLTVSTSGLPGGVPWSYSLNTSSFGVSSGNSTVTTASAGSYSVSGGVVEVNNGTEYVVTGVDVRADVVNQSSWTNTTAPGSVSIHGPAEVVLVYTPRYWLDVEATVGGSSGPSNGWFVPGTAVVLSETPRNGFHFVAWAGTGPGATSGSQNTQTTPTIHVDGPVTELANFVRNASLGDSITVTEAGLPAGVGFAFHIGSNGYTANGTITVTGFANGSYGFRAQNVSELATGEIGAVTGVSSTFVTNPNGTFAVVGNGAIQVNYSVLALVTTSVVGNGTITPGTEWVVLDSVLTVTATPSTGWEFTGLSTLLPSTVVPLSVDTFQVQVSSAGTVIAQFALIPPGPTPTYSLTITASGLPSGVEWNVSAGAYGTGGVGHNLTITGLPAGSYTVTIPTVYVGIGTRYVPSGTGTTSVTLPAASGSTVAFQTEYEVSILAGPGGSAGPATQWVAPGTQVALTATANSSDVFLNWTGAGSGSYSGTNPTGTITANGPVSEAATFGPMTPGGPSVSTSSGSTFPTLGVILLVALLAVGAIVGLLLGRRSGGAGPSSAPSTRDPSEEAPSETIYGETPAPSGDEAPSPPPE
jgi:BNR repeat protein/List-Bact-rpt repeat protein